ncbi:DUF1573 domain-containing protein [Arthrobacter sp. SX1312]|uniref:DUF1573 domain-containing protein n=1 Tax=Arthrobacter sp. SX1312 TaxID=2058896 RepID=UPI0011B08BBD|nr:DUF1573 domain-containing protein [Arthrobacter sp. SX1312]
MHRIQHGRRQSLARGSAALTVIAVLAVTGCSTPEETRDAIATGEDGQVGVVKLRSMLVVSAEEGMPGRLLGTLDNESSAAIEVTVSDADDQVEVTVPANGQYPLDTNEEILSTVEEPPGALTEITLTTPSDSVTLDVPVLDGTLDQYEPYLPD